MERVEFDPQMHYIDGSFQRSTRGKSAGSMPAILPRAVTATRDMLDQIAQIAAVIGITLIAFVAFACAYVGIKTGEIGISGWGEARRNEPIRFPIFVLFHIGVGFFFLWPLLKALAAWAMS